MTILKAGVMGWPVDHSLSPRLHGWWLKHYGIDGSYIKLPVRPEELQQALRHLPQQGFSGVNLTLPHKEAALNYVDHIEESAKRVSAVNTVLVREDGSLEGRNTDVYGFVQNLMTAGYKPGGKPAVILGAGGAARAAIVGLLEMGVPEIRIINRSKERMDNLIEIFGASLRGFSMPETDQALSGVELLVNATSLGMQGQPPLEITFETLPSAAVVMDMVYAPLDTALLRMVRIRGNPTVDGLGMLLHQARPAFHGFFGVDPAVTGELRDFVRAAL